MSVSRFLFALGVVLTVMAFVFWRVSPQPRIDQIVETRDPSQAPPDSGMRRHARP